MQYLINPDSAKAEAGSGVGGAVVNAFSAAMGMDEPPIELDSDNL